MNYRKKSLMGGVSAILSVQVDCVKKAFILGAGFGTRLRPLTDALPKPLLPIGGRPLIFRILDSLIDIGIENFYINTHHLASEYGKVFPRGLYRGRSVELLFEETILDTGGGVKNLVAKTGLDEPILVHNGDILLSERLDGFLACALAADSAASLLLRSNGATMNVGVRGNEVVDMRFKLRQSFDTSAQFAGVFLAKPEFLRFCAAEARGVFSTVDIFLKLLSAGRRLSAHFLDEGLWSDIGTLDEYMELK